MALAPKADHFRNGSCITSNATVPVMRTIREMKESASGSAIKVLIAPQAAGVI